VVRGAAQETDEMNPNLKRLLILSALYAGAVSFGSGMPSVAILACTIQLNMLALVFLMRSVIQVKLGRLKSVQSILFIGAFKLVCLLVFAITLKRTPEITLFWLMTSVLGIVIVPVAALMGKGRHARDSWL
jgi:hypothetical protein